VSTSVPLSSSSHADASPDRRGLAARVAGTLRAPRRTFAALVAAPRWIDVLVLVFVLSFAASALFLQTETGRLALVDQWERTALAFGQPVDDARYASFEAASSNGAGYAALTAFAGGPLLAFGISVLLFAVFSGILKGRAGYVQVLAIAAHAGVILALRQVIAAPVGYARETLASPATLGTFFGMLDEASPLARFLGAIDLFVVWWACVLAIGVSVLYRRRARPLALAFVGAYVLVAAILALIMALSGGTA
jgi:hypothetical protein